MQARIWNERSLGIGGIGAAKVITFLRRRGYGATACQSEFKDHEGVQVPIGQVSKAAHLVELEFGRK